MKKIIILLYLISLPVFAFCQYPLPIYKGETKTIKAEQDTLWILTDAQLRAAVTKAKELKIANEQIQLLQSKTLITNNIKTEKDSIVSIMTRDRDYYKKYWQTTESDLKIVGTQLKRQKFYNKLTLAGIIVAFIAGIYIAK